MGWYRVIKTVKGHRYAYLQTAWRENGRVRTYSRYIGPVSGGWGSAPAGNAARPHQRVRDGQLVAQFDAVFGGERTSAVAAAASCQPYLEGEAAFVESLFDPDVAAQVSWWEVPWKGGRYSSKPSWTPDRRLAVLSTRLGIPARSRPWATPPGVDKRSLKALAEKPLAEDGAWFNRSWRLVQIPDPSRFRDQGGVSAGELHAHTCLHEYAHATALSERCRRGSGAGRAAYALEEVTAEMAALLAGRRLGILKNNTARGAYYLQSWYKDISYEKGVRVKAEAMATQIADYLVELWMELPAPTGAAAVDMVELHHGR